MVVEAVVGIILLAVIGAVLGLIVWFGYFLLSRLIFKYQERKIVKDRLKDF